MRLTKPSLLALICVLMLSAIGCATSTGGSSFCRVYSLESDEFLLRQFSDAEWQALEPHGQQLALENVAAYDSVCADSGG